MSDIIKNAQQDEGPDPAKRDPAKESKELKKPHLKPKKASHDGSKGQHPKTQKTSKDTKAKISKAMNSHIGQEASAVNVTRVMKENGQTREAASELYKKAIETAKDVVKNAELGKSFYNRELDAAIDDIINSLILDDRELLLLCQSGESDNYIYAHFANVCILSLKIGIELGFNKSRLKTLGFSSFLHDIGMIKNTKEAPQPKTLTKQGRNNITGHPSSGGDIAGKDEWISEDVVNIVRQEHERIDGLGHPRGLSQDEIREEAQVVGIADVYEALTHDRPHRKKLQPHEVVREILKQERNQFDPKLIKTLIRCIGVYPIGSWVELNTGEIGRVISVNEDFPLRPVVSIMFGQDDLRLQEVKKIDLKKFPAQYIKGTADAERLNTIGDNFK